MNFTSRTRPRWRFKNEPQSVRFQHGRLELEFPRTTYIVTQWPEWRFSFRFAEGMGRPIQSPIARAALLNCLERLRLQTANPAARLAVYDLLRDLPAATHARLVKMGCRYWYGIDLLASCPGAAILLDSSPALFAATEALWSSGQSGITSVVELDTLTRGKQRHLAEQLGFNASESLCKILRRFESYALSAGQWRVLVRNLTTPEIMRCLQHAKSVPEMLVQFLSADDPAEVWTPSARADLAARALSRSAAARQVDLDEISEMGAMLRRHGLLRQQARTVDELVRITKRGAAMLTDTLFPIGPYIDLPGVCPITTPRDLEAEGAQMQHCVGNRGYVFRALSGQSCFYRMFHPERATIALCRGQPFGPWEFEQVQGVKNGSLKPETRAQIDEALRIAGVQTTSSADHEFPF